MKIQNKIGNAGSRGGVRVGRGGGGWLVARLGVGMMWGMGV